MQPKYATLNSHIAKMVGFTLIELSIVLVIIGLVAGGVLFGKDLIRAAEIRKTIKDIENYKTAVNTFKIKYNCIAGDCHKATDFWAARNANNATCLTTTPALGAPTPTCNGNNNGRVDDSSEEPFLFWQHLANANLIQGQYTGIHDGEVIYHHVLGQNCPASAIANAGFSFSYLDATGGTDGQTYAIYYGNMFWFGEQWLPAGGHRTQYSVFTPIEAMSVDQKIDDGKPATGWFVIRSNEIPFGSAGACSTSTSNADFTGVYNTSSSVKSCAFMIKTGL